MIAEYDYHGELIIQYSHSDFMAFFQPEDGDIIEHRCMTLKEAKKWINKQIKIYGKEKKNPGNCPGDV